MITDLTTTTTFPTFAPDDPYAYTLDQAYSQAQSYLWSSYFGILLSWALFSCLCIQTYVYLTRFRVDRPVIRYTVLLLFALEILSTAFQTWALYVTIVLRWGHKPVYLPTQWGSMIFDTSVASVVHALYGWRIFKLIERRWLAVSSMILIGLLSAAQFSSCLASAMWYALQYHQGPGHRFISRKFFHAWLANASVADVIITAILAIKLYTAKTGFENTDKTINKILYVSVPGGALTTLLTLMILLIQVSYVGSWYYTVLILSLSKVYSNSVLFCLNLRHIQRSQLGQERTKYSERARRLMPLGRHANMSIRSDDLEKANVVCTTTSPPKDNDLAHVSISTPPSSKDSSYLCSRGPVCKDVHVCASTAQADADGNDWVHLHNDDTRFKRTIVSCACTRPLGACSAAL